MLDDDNDYRCDGCGEPYPKSSLNKINGQYVCDDCAKEEFPYGICNQFEKGA